MKKFFFTAAFALMLCTFAHATITCTFVTLQIDTNEFLPIDVDGDGTNDYILQTAYSPYVNNFITGLNGNEIEVAAWSGNDANRCRRIESGDPVGSQAWNDTDYMIENGQGAFSGGSEEYGHIGLRLNKSGNYHYAFLEVRAPYWQALVAVYAIGYNDAAGAEMRTDVCPQPVGVEERGLTLATILLQENHLHVSMQGEIAAESEVRLINAAGQIVLSGKLNQEENRFPLQQLQSGIYIAVVIQNNIVAQRKKILLP